MVDTNRPLEAPLVPRDHSGIATILNSPRGSLKVAAFMYGLQIGWIIESTIADSFTAWGESDSPPTNHHSYAVETGREGLYIAFQINNTSDT